MGADCLEQPPEVRVALGAQADGPVHEDQRRFIAGTVGDVAAGIDHGGLLLVIAGQFHNVTTCFMRTPGTASGDRLDQAGDLAGLVEAGKVAGGGERHEVGAGDCAGVGGALSGV